jgi:mono/diheme cytochrome c family protein
MKRRIHKILIFSAATALFVCSAAFADAQGRGARGPLPNNPPPTSAVTGDAANGKNLFFVYSCYACHGYGGETGQRAFVGNWGHLSTEQEFIAFLRARGNVAPEPKSTSMPNFAESTMSDKQAKDIYAYIRSFKSTAPPLKDIPVLNAIVDAAAKPASK